MSSKISPFLWFDNQAEQAARFYVSVFTGAGRDAKILNVWPGPGGIPMGVSFEIAGTEIKALNGGPKFTFTEAISFFVDCETQDEVDYYWTKLSDGGYQDRCGWLKDKFGLSWQIVPSALGRMMGDKDPAKASRAMQAMLGMRKLDIAALQTAYDGK